MASKSVTVVGFDQDKHPLIAAESLGSPDSVEIWQVPAANHGHQIYAGSQLAEIVADLAGPCR